MPNTGKPLHVGLVHNWPGARNSEFDLIQRIASVLTRLGHIATAIDPLGEALDDEAQRTGRQADACDLTINLHYLNPYYLPGLSYVVNWNPLGYITDNPITREPVPIKQFSFIVDCLRSHHRVLSASSETVDRYAHAARAGAEPAWLEPASLRLHTTIEAPAPEAAPDVTAETLKVFYIGINWEKMSRASNRQVRHEGLFEVLDRSGDFEFYGLSHQAGIPLWDGIASYRGELPFDAGASIYDTSRRCGAALVLSSPQHRDSGVVSTRIFQAAAAGCVVISDRNPFIEANFGDSVCYFDVDEQPHITAENIVRTVAWVRSNWAEARQKAARCHQIFRERFDLSLEVEAICAQAQRDLETKAARTEALARQTVRVLYPLVAYQPAEAARFFANLQRQSHQNLAVTVAIKDLEHKGRLAEAARSAGVAIDIRPWPETLGCVIAELSPVDHLLVYSEGFEWHPDHLFGLLDRLVDQDANAAYVAPFQELGHLKAGDDPMDFFISGADGGYRAMVSPLLSEDLATFALGNVLLRGDLVLADLAMLEQFDLGVIHAELVAREARMNTTPCLAPRTTAFYVGSDEAYDEYRNAGLALTDKQREINMLAALARYFGTTVSDAYQRQLRNWEFLQAVKPSPPKYGWIGSDLEVRWQVSKSRRPDEANHTGQKLRNLAKQRLAQHPRLAKFARRLRGTWAR